jgi:hypothetical protein
MAKLLYGRCLWLVECLRLRVKDVKTTITNVLVGLHPRSQSRWPGRPQPAGLAHAISRRALGAGSLGARPPAPQVHEDTPCVHL